MNAKNDLGTAAGTGEPMEAGRELDALVAEKVMGDCGWDIVIEGTSRVGRYFQSREEAAAYRETITGKWHVGPVVLHGDVPEYSSNIAAAWQVVEKMQRMAFVCDLSVDCFANGSSAGVEVGFWKHRAEYAIVSADTAPLAICRAALKAVASHPVPASSPSTDISGGTGNPK